MTDILIDTDIELDDLVDFEEDETPEDDKKTHIVNPPNNLHIWQPGMTSKELVSIARINGYPVKALCGHVWIPKYNPDNYDACERCVAIAGELMRSNNE